jgi:outer membrane protein assembly factor BamB/orotate phosphoribosyltransferase
MGKVNENDKIERLKKIIRKESLFKYGGERGMVSSDKDSQRWIFNIRNACLKPDFLELSAEIFWDIFEKDYPFQIGGQELAAVPIMAAIVLLGNRIGKPLNAFVIRKSRKISRSQKMIEGAITEEKIILVDDAVSTGLTMIHGLKAVEQMGKSVSAFFSLVECGANQSAEEFKKYGIEHRYLFNPTDFNLTLPKYESIKSNFEKIWHFASPKPSYIHVVPKSAPVIDGEKIFFGSDNGNFWALRQTDGTIAWKFKVGYPVNEKSIFSTPVIDNEKVYFGSYDGNIYALEKSSGRLCWKFGEADFIGSSPALATNLGLLFIGLEFGLFRKRGGIAAIRTDTGEKAWDFRMPEYVHGSPAYCQEKRFVAIGGNDHSVYMFDAKNGKMKWKFKTAGDIKASLDFAPEKNLVIFGSFDKNLYFLDIDTGELKGKFETKDYIYSTPKVFKDNVYFTSTDKQLYSLDLNTGKLNWRFAANGRIFSSPEIVDNKVLFGSNGGIMYEVDIKSGKCKSIYQTAERITNKISYNPETKKYFLPTYANEIFCLKKIT